MRSSWRSSLAGILIFQISLVLVTISGCGVPAATIAAAKAAIGCACKNQCKFAQGNGVLIACVDLVEPPTVTFVDPVTLKTFSGPAGCYCSCVAKACAWDDNEVPDFGSGLPPGWTGTATPAPPAAPGNPAGPGNPLAPIEP